MSQPRRGASRPKSRRKRSGYCQKEIMERARLNVELEASLDDSDAGRTKPASEVLLALCWAMPPLCQVVFDQAVGRAHHHLAQASILVS